MGLPFGSLCPEIPYFLALICGNFVEREMLKIHAVPVWAVVWPSQQFLPCSKPSSFRYLRGPSAVYTGIDASALASSANKGLSTDEWMDENRQAEIVSKRDQCVPSAQGVARIFTI
jgi:hypothetical protein